MTRIVASSDFHGKLPTNIPECDLFLIAGDICPSGEPIEQAAWLNTTFRNWLETVPAKKVVAIAGNHDQIFERAPELVPINLRWHYLQDSFITINGLTIYGTPWQLPFWGAFNLSDGRLTEIYKKIPNNTDIIISHGPPFGIHDEVPGKNSPIHTGSNSLRTRVLQIKPKLCIFGHIHQAYGLSTQDGITFANVSLVNDDLKIAHNPRLFDLNS